MEPLFRFRQLARKDGRMCWAGAEQALSGPLCSCPDNFRSQFCRITGLANILSVIGQAYSLSMDSTYYPTSDRIPLPRERKNKREKYRHKSKFYRPAFLARPNSSLPPASDFGVFVSICVTVTRTLQTSSWYRRHGKMQQFLPRMHEDRGRSNSTSPFPQVSLFGFCPKRP